MTPFEWFRAYERENEKEFTKVFDSNGEPMFDDPKLFDTYIEKFLIRVKRKYVFYELQYWEHLKIFHLLDPMHIFKNVSCYLWRHISSKGNDTLSLRRDFITSKTKKKHWPRQETRGEASTSWSFKEGDVPWIFKKDDLSLEKEVIMIIRVPSLYGSSLWCCFTMEDHLLGLE